MLVDILCLKRKGGGYVQLSEIPSFFVGTKYRFNVICLYENPILFIKSFLSFRIKIISCPFTMVFLIPFWIATLRFLFPEKIIRIIQADELKVFKEKFNPITASLLYKLSYLIRSSQYMVVSSIRKSVPDCVAKSKNVTYFMPIPRYKGGNRSSSLPSQPTVGVLFRGARSKGFSTFVDCMEEIKQISNSSVKIYVYPDVEAYNFPSWCSVEYGLGRTHFLNFISSVDIFINLSEHDAVSFINIEVLDQGVILLCRDLSTYDYLPKEGVFKFVNNYSLVSQLRFIYENIEIINSKIFDWPSQRNKLSSKYEEDLKTAMHCADS